MSQNCRACTSPWNSPVQNAGVRSLSLLQGIFPTQGLNLGLPHCRWILFQLSHKGSPRIMKWITYPFSSRSSQPRNRTKVSCIAGGFFNNWVIREHFSMYEKTQESALTEIILLMSMFTYLGPLSCVFTSWVSSWLTVRDGYSLMAAKWQILSSFLSFLRAHWLVLMTMTSLFTDMEGNISHLKIFHFRKCSISYA